MGEDVTYNPGDYRPVIHRHEIPVDDQWHAISGYGEPVYVACRNPDVVEFWAFRRPDLCDREYRVYGTGHSIDGPGAYVGTAIAPGGKLVWHLMSRS